MNEKKDISTQINKDIVQDVKAKKGLNLMFKIMGIVLIPMVVLVIFADLALEAVGNDTAAKLVSQELNAMQYNMEVNLSNASDEGFRFENNGLYKGPINLSEDKAFLENFKANTGVDVALFWNDTVAVSSKTEMMGYTADSKITNQVLGGDEYSSSSLKINGNTYYTLIAPIYGAEGTSPVGMLMTAIPTDEVKALYSRVVETNIIFMVVLVAVFCVLALAVVIFITRTLLSVVGNLDNVSRGLLNFRISNKMLTRSDEIGKIARSVHSVISGFSSMVGDIHKSMTDLDNFTGEFRENFATIGQSIDNINIAINDIAEGATKQASDTQEVSESLVDMNNAINRTTENVNDLNESANTMKGTNEKVADTLKELLDISIRTRESVDEVQKQTNLTNSSAQDIRSATEIIAGIASKTNLLSLNASIEAARAGEMGRGFAVVAEEIRGLADQSKESADKIRTIVESLIQNSDDSVEIMNQVVDEIHNQNEKLEVTQDAFTQLNAEVQHVVVAIKAISDEIERIDQYKNGVKSSVDGLSIVSQNSAANTEETAATMEQLGQIVARCNKATEDLVTISDELMENARKFKI